MSRGWFPATESCRCGHGKDQHGPDGRCNLYQEARPVPGTACMVERDPGTCWCKAFDGEPWAWTVASCYTKPRGDPDPDRPGWIRFPGKDDRPDHYTVSKQGHDKTYGPYKTKAAAERRCDELNREMAQGPLDPAFKARRDRLVRLAPGGVYYLHEGAPGTQWPIKPDRYLGFGLSDGWHGDSWVHLYPTLDAVREALEDEEGNEIERVVDLDTGEDVPFERRVSVRVGAAS